MTLSAPALAFNNVMLLMSVKVHGLTLEGVYGNEVNRDSRVCLSMTHCLFLLFLVFFFFLPLFFSVAKHLQGLDIRKRTQEGSSSLKYNINIIFSF